MSKLKKDGKRKPGVCCRWLISLAVSIIAAVIWSQYKKNVSDADCEAYSDLTGEDE